VTESVIDAGAAEWSTRGNRVWPADAGQLAAIRAEVHRRLAALGLPEDTEQDLVLAVNEAVTNAIEHAYRPAGAGGDVELGFWLADGHLHIAVVDHGTWREPPVGPRERGFGLGLMDRLVAGVAVHHDADGTRVVLRHPLADAGPGQASGDDVAGHR
jgi:anti-sigma regulatory factor (Ser/Thr protein kinase)